jgi:succinate dehydrogenase / fumarate reductase cytochrome b subunit
MASDVSSKPATADRPLSPHLQIYRWQWTMALSILHRITGVALAVGTIVLVWWLIAAATGPGYFGYVQSLLAGWFGRLLLFGWTLALFYHLCNGIRHLFWDAGKGFALGTARASGMVVLAATAILTLVAWLAGYGLI